MPQVTSFEQDDELIGWAISVDSKTPETKQRMTQVLDIIEAMPLSDLRQLLAVLQEEEAGRASA